MRLATIFAKYQMLSIPIRKTKSSQLAAAQAVLLIVAAWLPGAAQAYELDPSSFLRLSKVCQAWYVSAYHSGKVEGMSLQGMKNDWEKYKRVLGSAHPWMNHYCPGLVGLSRLETSYYGVMDDKQKDRAIKNVMSELSYQIKHTETWNDQNIWLKAEVYNAMGRAQLLKGDVKEAAKYFDQSIKTFPPYIPAYWALAETQAKAQQFDDAQSTLEAALGHAKAKQHVQLIEAKIQEYALAQENLGQAQTPAAAEGESQ